LPKTIFNILLQLDNFLSFFDAILAQAHKLIPKRILGLNWK
jgi:hypothetical protein